MKMNGLGQTLGSPCTPTTPPVSLFILGGGLGLAFLLPGAAKLLGLAVAAYGAFGMACTGSAGEWVGSPVALGDPPVCQWTSTCNISL
jgi:hypothetical protein